MNIRNLTLSIVALTLAGGAMAQRVTPRSILGFRPAAERITPRAPRPVAEAIGEREQIVVFSEDFANGFAGNNGFGAWTTSGANGDVWRTSLFGPSGAYSDPVERIESTTVANGFAIFNSDSANTDFSVNPPVQVANAVDLEGSLIFPELDLSLTPAVEVVFEQAVRYCCGDAPNFLEVSNDGGLSWPFSYSTAVGIGANSNGDTDVRKINITSAISANTAQVLIRFRHSGDAGTSAYHWQIDDIKIQTLEEYDMRMIGATSSSFVYETAGTFDSLFYSVYPFNQLRELPLNMTVLNNGAATETGAVANFTITEGANVESFDVPVSDLAPGAQRTIYVDPAYMPPMAAGTYAVEYTITSGDTDPVADNMASSSFKVDEYRYGRDGGTITSFEDGDGVGGELVLGNAFYVRNLADLQSISVLIGTQSDIGAIVVGQVRMFDADFTVVATTQEVNVTSSMLNPTGGSNWTEMIFSTPYTLDPNTDYLITVEAFGHVRIGENGTSPDQTSFIRYNSPTQGLDWFFTTNTTAVRMNFDPTVGIEARDRQNGVGLGQNMPNPSKGSTIIPYELQNTAKVTFEVRDMSGKLVYTKNEGTKGAGTYRFNLDTDALGEGVYTYTMVAGDVRQTKSMTVIH